MKNETVSETLTLAQVKEKMSDLLALKISTVQHGSPQHKKLKLAQAVFYGVFSVADNLKTGTPESVVDALAQMKMDVDMIQAQPVPNPEKFTSGGIVTTKPLKNNLQVSGEPVHLPNKKASK